MTHRIAIVGAGISGLAAALHLLEHRPGVMVELFDQAPQAGGKVRSERVDGFVIEQGPDAFLAAKPGGIALGQHLGLAPRMVSPIPAHRQSFVMRQGHLQPLPQGLSGLVPGDLKPILRSPLLSRAGKLRLAMEYMIPRRKDAGDESIAGFMRRRYGRETWDRMIEPLLTGIYGGDGDQLGIAATFPNLPAMEAAHGSLLRGAIAARRAAAGNPPDPAQPKGFISFDGGMGVLTDAAIDEVMSRGGQLTVNAPVSKITRQPGTQRFTLTMARNGSPETAVFDQVMVATPAWAAAPLLRDIAPAASAALAGIEHSSSGLVALAFPASQLTRPLKGYGYVVPRAEGRDVTAMTWVSSKWNDRVPEGYAMVRVFLGRSGREAVLARDDADLVELAIAEMGEVLGLVVSPSLSRVQRWQRAMPQYVVGHLNRVERIESAMAAEPGVAVAGTMFRGVGIPDAISTGQRAAAKLIADLEARPASE